MKKYHKAETVHNYPNGNYERGLCGAQGPLVHGVLWDALKAECQCKRCEKRVEPEHNPRPTRPGRKGMR